MSNIERSDTQPVDPDNPEVRVAAKMFELLKKSMGDLAPTGVAVASHSKSHILFNFHYANHQADAAHTRLNGPWVLLTFALGGTQGSCIDHGDDLIQASISGHGITLDKFERALDKHLAGGKLLG